MPPPHTPFPCPVDDVQRLCCLTRGGWGRRPGRELAARLPPCRYGDFPRIVTLLRLDEMDGDNQHFAHDGHYRHALFHATSHQALVVSPKGGCLQVNAS